MKKVLCIFLLILLPLSVLGQVEADLARSYMERGEYEKAEYYFQKLFTDNPYNMNYLGGLVKCYQEQEKLEEAEALLKAQLQRPRIPPVVYIELGYNYDLQRQEQAAQQEYEKALKSIDSQPAYAYAVGQGFRAKQLLDEAVRAFERGMALDPKLNFNYDLAYIYGEQGDLEKMYNTYLDLIVERTNLKENIKRNIGRFLFEDGSNEGNTILRKVLLQRVQKDPNIVWNELLSWLFIQQKQYRNALTQEKAIYRRAEAPTLEGIIDLGLIAFNDNHPNTAKEAFTFITENSRNPATRVQAHYYLMEVAVQGAGEEEVEDVLQDFDKLLDTYGKDEQTVRLQIQRAHFLAFRAGEPDRAIGDLKALLDLNMDVYSKALVRMELADILVYTEQFNQALIYYSQVQKDLKNDVMGQEARFRVARTSFYKGDFDWAETQLKILKSSTSQLIANDALELKLVITDNSLQDSTQVALNKFARAHLLAYQNQKTDAVEVLENITTEHKGEPVEDEALMMQAELLLELGEPLRAEENYIKVIEFFPADIFMDDALFNLAMLYIGELEQPEKAVPLLERIIFEHPDSIYFPRARKKFRELRGDEVTY